MYYKDTLSYKRSLSDFSMILDRFTNGKFSFEMKDTKKIFKIMFKYELFNFCFKLDDKFPFSNPKLFINNKNYLDLLKIDDEIKRDIIKKEYDLECLCCNTRLCYNNWSPAIKLIYIVDEFIRNKDIIVYCYHKKYLLELNKTNNYIFPDEIIDIICNYLLLHENF